MKTRELTPNLLQLTRAKFVNAYLVREDDGFTLIDTTLAGAGKDLIAAARSCGEEIRRIALTHGHGDHVGSLDELRRELGGDVEVLLGDADARVLAGEARKPKGSWKTSETKIDVRLHGGERVGSLEAIASPGHTAGHIAFLDHRDRTLIAGDVFSSYGRVAVTSSFYWRFPLPLMGTEDRAEDLRSAQMLAGLEPSLLVVGHGPAVSRPIEAMRKAILSAGA